MELHQLRYFVAAAEAGSISRAAQRCRIAQPSLSQQIKKLEETLGAPLFDRMGRGVALTDAGRALLPRARRILQEVQDTRDNLDTDIERGSGVLSIGAIPTIAPYLLPEALARFRTEFPDSTVSVREDLTEHLLEALADNELDVAIMSTPVEHELVEHEVIGSEPLVVVAPAGTPLCPTGADPGVTLSDLRSQPTVTLHEMHCLGQQISGFCADRGLARNITCRTTQLATVLEFVRLGMGVSIVPAMAARADTSPDRVYLRVKTRPPTREISLVRRAGRARSRRVDRLGEIMAEILAEHERT
ncbi:MAG: LysR family transcriptional regulator [Phycisphaerales bacterium]|nr:LysR family transcriptional regulator [Phycisphaerales bacterium]